jgi:hypothetical protein
MAEGNLNPGSLVHRPGGMGQVSPGCPSLLQLPKEPLTISLFRWISNQLVDTSE